MKNHNRRLISVIILCLVAFTSCNSISDDNSASSTYESNTEIKEISYETMLFDDSYVHEINIILSEDDKNDLLTRAMEKNKYIADVEIDGQLFTNVRISTKGSSTLYETAMEDGNDCYSLKLAFEYDNVKNSYYGLDSFCLNNNNSDDSKLFDHIAYQMYDTLGIPSPLTSYVHVTLNGENYGVLLALEDVNKSFLKRNGLEDAELYKPEGLYYEEYVKYKLKLAQEAKDTDTVDDFLKIHGDIYESTQIYFPIFVEKYNIDVNKGWGKGADLKYKDDNPESYIEIFNNSVTNCSAKDKESVIKALKNLSENKAEESLYTDKVIAYFVSQNFQINWDGICNSHNYYLLEKDGKLMLIPWDNNLAMTSFRFYTSGLTDKEIYEYQIEDVMTLLGGENHPMWQWITNDGKWLSEYYDITDKLLTVYFESGKCIEEIERVYEILRPYIEKDDSNICTLDEYDTSVNNLKTFIKERTISVRSQVDDYKK